MKPMSAASHRHHIKTAGMDRCPYCKAVDEDGDVFGCEGLEPIEDGDVEQKVTCNKCGRRWLDVFRLVEVHELTATE